MPELHASVFQSHFSCNSSSGQGSWSLYITFLCRELCSLSCLHTVETHTNIISVKDLACWHFSSCDMGKGEENTKFLATPLQGSLETVLLWPGKIFEMTRGQLDELPCQWKREEFWWKEPQHVHITAEVDKNEHLWGDHTKQRQLSTREGTSLALLCLTAPSCAFTADLEDHFSPQHGEDSLHFSNIKRDPHCVEGRPILAFRRYPA